MNRYGWISQSCLVRFYGLVNKRFAPTVWDLLQTYLCTLADTFSSGISLPKAPTLLGIWAIDKSTSHWTGNCIAVPFNTWGYWKFGSCFSPIHFRRRILWLPASPSDPTAPLRKMAVRMLSEGSPLDLFSHLAGLESRQYVWVSLVCYPGMDFVIALVGYTNPLNCRHLTAISYCGTSLRL